MALSSVFTSGHRTSRLGAWKLLPRAVVWRMKASESLIGVRRSSHYSDAIFDWLFCIYNFSHTVFIHFDYSSSPELFVVGKQDISLEPYVWKSSWHSEMCWVMYQALEYYNLSSSCCAPRSLVDVVVIVVVSCAWKFLSQCLCNILLFSSVLRSFCKSSCSIWNIQVLRYKSSCVFLAVHIVRWFSIFYSEK